MMDVVSCVWFKHNIWMVVLAAALCALGSLAMVELFSRAVDNRGYQRLGWAFLAAVSAGSSIWCTHFVAILAFEPGAPVEIDATLTVLSLLVAIAGAAVGVVVALGSAFRGMPSLGGALLGLAISAMHYFGMLAYRVPGLVEWRVSYVVASVVMAAGFSALAAGLVVRTPDQRRKFAAALALTAGIVTLHFTGMAAFRVTLLRIDVGATNDAATRALALAVVCAGVVVLATGVVSFLIDTGVRSDAYQKLRFLAMNDSLTGLPNRAAFHEFLNLQIAETDRRQKSFALIDIDLDGFSDVNDFNGHSVGDEVLQVVASRIAELSSQDAWVARVGGDEFAGVYRYKDRAQLRRLLEDLRAKIMAPMRIEESDVSVGASVGVAIYPEDASERETLINNADLAMYRAKDDPQQKICFYKSEMGEAVRTRRRLTAELREAIDRSELEMYYQVQKSVSSGEIVGYEALLRWKHSKLGFIPPSEFIPLAESCELILPIGAWALRTACEQAASWAAPCKVAVNVSAVQFAHANLPRLVHETLLQTGLSPSRLELELTESTILADKQRSLDTLRRIKALGVSIALDDFGTGYSSLETLRTFHFDKIKLDRFFMCEIESSDSAKAILRAVLTLGRGLKIPVLAEGIETETQLSMMKFEGCSEAQGYLLGRPAPLRQHILEGRIQVLDAASLAQEPARPQREPRRSTPYSMSA
jgi:diguanylate cyclase (GGDEF)-like protein